MWKFIKKFNRNKISVLAAIVIAVGYFVIPHFAHADALDKISAVFTSGLANVFKFTLEHAAFPILMNLSSFAMVLASIFLRITAALLNTTIMASLHISDLLAQTPAITNVWKIIRDFSNIFLIFLLLYASITMILGTKGPKFSELIVSIVIAGLLINFSLFFTKLAIDASNVLALSFYKAIDSAGEVNNKGFTYDGLKTAVLSSENGLANAFMQSLRIQTLYDAAGKPLTGNGFGGQGVELRIVIAGVMGVVIMVIAGLSFLAAAVMFAIRLVYLMILMAFSPLMFMGMIFPFPAIQSKAKDWVHRLIGQCLFAPVYLMFMYVVLRILTDKGFSSFMGVTNASTFAGDLFSGKSIGTVLQYSMVIILMNAGLMTAVSIAGESGKFGMMAQGWAKKKLGTVGGFAWRNTGGSVAHRIADSEYLKDKASKSMFATGAMKGLRNIAKPYSENLDKKVKIKTQFAESLGSDKEQLHKYEADITAKKSEISQLNVTIANPTAPAAVKASAKARKENLEGEIKKIQAEISTVKRARQDVYAKRIDPREIDPTSGKLKPVSLWERVKITKAKQIASAQLDAKNTEAEIVQHKKDLEDLKKDREEDKKELKGFEKRIREGKVLTAAENAKMDDLKKDIFKATKDDISDKEKEISDAELSVKALKNIN